MIRGFRDKKTQQFFAGEMVKEFSGFRKVAERKLTMLDNATDLKDPSITGRQPTGKIERRSGRPTQYQDQ